MLVRGNSVISFASLVCHTHIAVPLTDAEYGDAYSEALLCLADEGHAVGTPFINGFINGASGRRCMVDDCKLSDREVLELYWGEDIAGEILQGRGR